jgi:hypothetical protein
MLLGDPDPETAAEGIGNRVSNRILRNCACKGSREVIAYGSGTGNGIGA